MTLTLENTKENAQRINPQLFGLWIALASITMMFGGFTSAYIVKQAAGNWYNFAIPSYFYVSTVLIILSSLALQYSYNSFVNGEESKYKISLVLSFVLGVIFLVCQYFGWMGLYHQGIDLKLNVSSSFLYLIMWAHAAHVIGGLSALIVAMIHAFTLKFKPTVKRKNGYQLVLHYWHYLTILWLVIFGFILFVK